MNPSRPSVYLPAATRLGRTALRVADLGRTTRFYRDVIGLSILDRTDGQAVLGTGTEPLLVLHQDRDAPSRRRAETGLYHNAFRVPSRQALGDVLVRIRDRWSLSGAADHGVSEALYLTDPENNDVEVYRDHPQSEWPIAQNGRVQLTSRPLDLESIRSAAIGGRTVPPNTDLGHVHLEVRSLETFERFYVERLGFEVRSRLPGAVFVAAGNYHHHVAANTWHHRTAPLRGGRGICWFEIALPDADAIAVVKRRLVEHGFEVDGTATNLTVTDPHGIEVRLRAVGA